MSSNGKPRTLTYDTIDDTMDESNEDNRGDDIDFHHACLEEIDRYRRMDEWIPSYNNVLSITALDCKRQLVKARSAEFNLVEFLQYTRDGTSDDLRLSAFRAIMEMELVKQDKILQWFLMVLGSDPSPYLREHMSRLLGKLLAALAIGEFSASATHPEIENGGLTIENDDLMIEDTSTDARKKAADRKKTVPGALDALKEEIGGNEVLREGLWAAVSSPSISLQEMGHLIDICSLLYTPKLSLIVKLRLPRYWKCRNLGNCKLLFTHSGRYRENKMPQRQLPASIAISVAGESASSTAAPMPPPIKRALTLKPPKKESPSLPSFPSIPSATSSLSTDSSASQPLANPTQAQPRPEGRKIFKLKMPTKARSPT